MTRTNKKIVSGWYINALWRCDYLNIVHTELPSALWYGSLNCSQINIWKEIVSVGKFSSAIQTG